MTTSFLPSCRAFVRLRAVLRLLVLAASVAPAAAQPAVSRGEQELPIPHDECMRRAEVGLLAEGYVNLWRTGSSVAGYREIHSTIIMCNGSPNAMTWANIVTASLASDGGVPGAERVRLQERMNQPSTPGGNTGGAYTLTVNPPSAAPGVPLTVSFSAPTGRPANDWVGLYRVGDPNTSSYGGWWQYTGGRVTGTLQFPAPGEPGQYEFRYLLNNGYDEVVARVGLTVSN
jgi:hypothetical protein